MARAAENVVAFYNKRGTCEQWIKEGIGNQRLTGAPLDRLTHHVHILELNGESYRHNEAKTAARPSTRR
jgi:DNA replication protein DnaC